MSLRGKKGFSKFSEKLQNFVFKIHSDPIHNLPSSKSYEVSDFTLTISSEKCNLLASVQGVKADIYGRVKQVRVDNFNVKDEDMTLLSGIQSPFLDAYEDETTKQYRLSGMCCNINSFFVSNMNSLYKESFLPVLHPIATFNSVKLTKNTRSKETFKNMINKAKFVKLYDEVKKSLPKPIVDPSKDAQAGSEKETDLKMAKSQELLTVEQGASSQSPSRLYSEVLSDLETPVLASRKNTRAEENVADSKPALPVQKT